MAPNTPHSPDPAQDPQGIPEQLYQIAHEQEGGAERVLDQMEVVQSSFEEIQSRLLESMELLRSLEIDQASKDRLLENLSSITAHVDNGLYNLQGAFDLYQYQDIVRQKLEKVGHSLIEVSEFVLSKLAPGTIERSLLAPMGRDILEKEVAPDSAKPDADRVVAEFFAKMRKEKQAPQKSAEAD